MGCAEAGWGYVRALVGCAADYGCNCGCGCVDGWDQRWVQALADCYHSVGRQPR